MKNLDALLNEDTGFDKYPAQLYRREPILGIEPDNRLLEEIDHCYQVIRGYRRLVYRKETDLIQVYACKLRDMRIESTKNFIAKTELEKKLKSLKESSEARIDRRDQQIRTLKSVIKIQQREAGFLCPDDFYYLEPKEEE
jgi:hypothetical protein